MSNLWIQATAWPRTARDDFRGGDSAYHVTPHEFQPGDMIEPGHPQTLFNETPDVPRKHVYFSRDMDEAREYADTISSIHGRAHIYQVHLTGPTQRDPEENLSWMTSHPMRVHREIANTPSSWAVRR